MRKTEERILLMISRDTSVLLMFRVSTERQFPSKLVEAPRALSISSITNTSPIRGQSFISCLPGLATAAAKMGRAEFLAPFILYSPFRGTPPCI